MTSRALTVAVLGTGTIGAQVPATCCGQDSKCESGIGP